MLFARKRICNGTKNIATESLTNNTKRDVAMAPFTLYKVMDIYF